MHMQGVLCDRLCGYVLRDYEAPCVTMCVLYERDLGCVSLLLFVFVCERNLVWPGGYPKEDNILWVRCLLSPPLETLRYLTEGSSLHVTPKKTHVPARPVVHVWASSEVTSPKELSGCWLWDIGASSLVGEGKSIGATRVNSAD